MPKASPIFTQVNAGELSPFLEGRVDIGKYPNGLQICENFIPLIQGPAQRRAGTRNVSSVKDQNDRTWLMPFVFSSTDGWILEFGDQYIRFYTDRGQVLDGGLPYEIVSPYLLADLTDTNGTFRINYVQSADVVYLAHPSYPVYKLSRFGNTNWTITEVNTTAGPFQDVNSVKTTKVYSSGTTGTVTLTANQADFFNANQVGSMFYMESQPDFVYTPWETGKAITLGLERRSDGNIYEAVNAATTASIKPTHTEGTRSDGGVNWKYLHSGYGWVKITAIVNTPLVNMVITGAANNGSGLIRITSNAHGFVNGQPVDITGVTGTTEANGKWFVTGVAANTFDLLGSTFTNAYVSGGNAASMPNSQATAEVVSTLPSAVKDPANATYKWAFSAWGVPYGGFPSHVTFFRERLTFARGDRIWMSVSADYENFAKKDADVVTADRAISIQLASDQVSTVQWLAPSNGLIVGTTGPEFVVSEITTSEPLGPNNVKASPQSAYGSRNVPAIRVGAAVLFIQRSGKKVREIKYDLNADAYVSIDDTILANHITKSGIVSMAFAQEPDSVIWCARTDGKLLGFTFNREQDVIAWHRHPLGGDGIVESVASIPSPDSTRDDLWMIVRRTINGQTARYVEFIEKPYEDGDDPKDSFYVDSGATYSGAPTTLITGLSYLEGQVVDVLADGATHPQRTVTGGQITLQRNASKVQVGLPCPAVLQTMRIEAGSADGTAQGKVKRITRAIIRFLNTLGGKAGKTRSELDTIQFRTASDPMNQAPPIFTGDQEVPWPAGYETEGQIMIVQDQPLPMTVVAIMPILNTNGP
jgi:hypothetical protein